MLLGASTVLLAALALFNAGSVRIRGFLCVELVFAMTWGAWFPYQLPRRTVASGTRFEWGGDDGEVERLVSGGPTPS
ncbi:hypothetical protein DL768_008871 [Monosporascus sp. mg162]|nr:hypothetical protein DL768_008871 [Monosporascus sp. mg162]